MSDATTPKFRGTWVPSEVHKALQQGKITCTEFVLLAIIDSLSPCWASRAYLAKRIHKSVGYTKHTISKLKKLGLIKEVGVRKGQTNKIPVLATVWWSDSNRAISSTINRATNSTKKNNTIVLFKREKPGAGKPAPGDTGKLLDGLSKSIPKSQAFAHECATRLRQIITEDFKILTPWRKAEWAKEFKILENRYGQDRVDEVLSWYDDNCTDRQELKLPTVKSASHFKNAFHWIEERMEQDQEPKGW